MPADSPSRWAVLDSVRRAFYQLRTEGSGPGREAAALGLGAFIGCTPFYGFHLLLCWAAGRLLGLNRLKMYLAANVSNPLMAPFLLLAEVQTGAWFRRGPLHTFALDTLDVRVLGSDLMVGSLIVGGALAAFVAAITYATLRTSSREAGFAELVRPASDRYVSTSVTAWEFARGKLGGDPVYRDTLACGLLRSGRTLLDVGCGQGLMLTLLADARSVFRDGLWHAGWPDPPVFERLLGIELRPRATRAARRALAGVAEIVEADARAYAPEGCAAILVFDVLHMMPPRDQKALLSRLAAALAPEGVMLVREADARAGWRFQAVRAVNRLKAIAWGSWRQPFHFRSTQEWQACFTKLGFDAVAQPGDGKPRANVLIRITKGS